jgi:uroporphyrinogen decarboxylase
MNKRDALFNLLDPAAPQPYVPAAFFLHFDPAYHRGHAAVDKHLEFFRYTGMDLVKIQYEHNFPAQPAIRRPQDWVKAPLLKEDFFAEPLQVVEGLVQAAKAEAVVVVTLYSPFMFAGQLVGDAVLSEHLRQDPEAVRPGLEIVTESMLHFVRGCIRAGVDGFYASTQGGEAQRFPGTSVFEEYVRPFDLAVWDEIHPACPFNILHICDYRMGYASLEPFLGYPGQVVNASLELEGRRLRGQEVAELFDRPFMGGMDRLGVLAAGSEADVRSAALQALREAPARFILAADCTVPANTHWANLKAAVETAHEFRRA